MAAAALVGFYPPLILATGEQLTEPFGAFWLTTAFALMVVAARLGRAWIFGVGGLALGAAVLTRADLLPPFVLAALVVLWIWRAQHRLRRGLLIGALILGGALLVIAPGASTPRNGRMSSCRSPAARARRCSSARTCRAAGRRSG